MKKRKSLRIPPILLEGDPPVLKPSVEPKAVSAAASPVAVAPSSKTTPAPASETVPTAPFAAAATPSAAPSEPTKHPVSLATAPAPSPQSAEPQPTSLPQAYGTGKLYLTARDPRQLYANWDLTSEQQHGFTTRARHGQLTLRVFQGPSTGAPLSEIRVRSDSRHTFLQVERPGTTYSAELGFYQPDGLWFSVAVSAPATTPPAGPAPAQGQSIRFAAVPAQPQQPSRAISARAAEHQDTLREPALPKMGWPRGLPDAQRPKATVAELVRRTLPEAPSSPAGTASTASSWSPTEERVFEEVLRLLESRQDAAGSLAIVEKLERRLRREGPTQQVQSAPGMPVVIEAISSPTIVAPEKPREFWFNVNAELVLYGATEPDARVTVGGLTVPLRADGTFTCRFALPDGQYELLAEAISKDGDTRAARLAFSRRTQHRGEVGAAPGNETLNPPPSGA